MVKYILAYVISCALFCYFSYDYGVGKGNLKLSQFKQQITEQAYKDVVKLQQQISANETKKQNEIRIINNRHAAIVSSLRNRPERPAEAAVATTISSGTGSTGQQLFREDAEFLGRQAQLADTLKESLTSCRRYLLEINK